MSPTETRDGDPATSSLTVVPAAPAEEDRSEFPSRLRRSALIVGGFVFTGLAIAGAILPLVPATPFLLLAASCFARSSPRFHRWLLSNRQFGPYLTQWRRDRTIPRSAKRKAYLVVALSFGSSIALLDGLGLRVALLVLGIAVLLVLARLPTAPRTPQQPD